MRPITNIERTPGIAALIRLASLVTKSTAAYVDEPIVMDQMHPVDAAEAYDNGYRPPENHGSLWVEESDRDLSKFWRKLEELRAKSTDHQMGNHVRKSPVVEELMDLASKRSKVIAVFSDYPFGPRILPPNRYYVGTDFLEDAYRRDYGSILTDNSASPEQTGAFWEEFRRLEKIVTEPLNEPILPDDKPVHQGLLYIKNGKMVEFIDGINMTVGRWKQLDIPGVEKAVEIRRCDIVGRQLRLPLTPPARDPKKMAHRWNASGKRINQAKRRPGCSNKINKVK